MTTYLKKAFPEVKKCWYRSMSRYLSQNLRRPFHIYSPILKSLTLSSLPTSLWRCLLLWSYLRAFAFVVLSSETCHPSICMSFPYFFYVSNVITSLRPSSLIALYSNYPHYVDLFWAIALIIISYMFLIFLLLPLWVLSWIALFCLFCWLVDWFSWHCL